METIDTYYKLIDGSFYESDIYEFAKERNFKVKVLYGIATKTKESDNSICTAEPSEFLNLVRHAEFIFTSSYHGLAFSLIYSKPFYAAFGINSERAASILKKLHLEDKLLESMARIPRTYSKIDYLRINEAILQMNMKSVDYLRSLERFPVDHI